MAPNMLLEIVSREIVKPSLSNHPPIHNLSSFDQLMPCTYVPFLFLYTRKHGETDDHKSSLLKGALSSALSRYYPLAGRLKDNTTLDCNDEGVLFLEARAECNLSEVPNYPEDEIMKRLCPDGLCLKDSFLTGPVAVQVTNFMCGGSSVGLCLCHKVMDMQSMSSFISEWASIARNINHETTPEFDVASLYPPVDLSSLKEKTFSPSEVNDLVSRRLLFDGSKIAKLKAVMANQVPNPTRIEIVSSLIYKSAMSAAAKASSSGYMTPSVMMISMNFRSRVSPPLSERKQGNVVGTFEVLIQDSSEVELGSILKEIRRSKARLSDFCANANPEEIRFLSLNRMESTLEYLHKKYQVYFVTSWCRYPLYETDFGWGKPLLVSTDISTAKNAICLMDTKGGDGIEVFICFEAKVMALFEQDQELLSFAKINPKIFD